MGSIGTISSINTKNNYANINTLDNLRTAYTAELDRLSAEQYESSRSFGEELDVLDTRYYRVKDIDANTYKTQKQNLINDRQSSQDYYNKLIEKANKDFKARRDELENK